MTFSACPVHIARQLIDSPANLLLMHFSSEEYREIAPDLECVSLPLGKMIHYANEPIEYIYFPDRAMISLIATMENGATTEISLVGKEGMVGLPALLGGNSITYDAIVQVMGTAMRIKSSILKEKFDRFVNLRQVLLLYTQVRLSYISQLAACNRQHKIENRLARWLLLVQDCIVSNHLPLTQEFIANMLGTNRAGVTLAARKLQDMGVISYSRGQITVLNRQKLETVSCECYRVMSQETSRLFGNS